MGGNEDAGLWLAVTHKRLVLVSSLKLSWLLSRLARGLIRHLTKHLLEYAAVTACTASHKRKQQENYETAHARERYTTRAHTTPVFYIPTTTNLAPLRHICISLLRLSIRHNLLSKTQCNTSSFAGTLKLP